MRLLWLCNLLPGAIRQAVTGAEGSGLWMDQTLAGLRREEDLELRLLCRGDKPAAGTAARNLSYYIFPEPRVYRYQQDLEQQFTDQLRAYQPEVIHIWGTEYGHTLAMLRVCRRLGLLDRTVVSIQGLCSVYARHYAEGIPASVYWSTTLRDLLRLDNIPAQQRKYVQRGRMELEALGLARHVIGRTPWDKACTQALAEKAQYHFCNESLREPFYEGQWRLGACRKHRIFASSLETPIKGFHYLLEALTQVLRRYPDATLAVPGKSFFPPDPKAALKQQTYHRYLCRYARAHGLEGKIEFLGFLSPEDMKREFLQSHVFALPSTVENSPNALGEAMLLGVPCVAAHVGGVSTLLKDREEGFLYPSTEPLLLASAICRVFDMEEGAASLGRAAQAHAQVTHDPEANLRILRSIYDRLQKGAKEP